MKLLGGIEAGGTKIVCAVGDAADPRAIVARTQFPTTTPAETLGRCLEFFDAHATDLLAIGIASFGPIDVHPTSPTYGYVTTTTKPGWSHTNFRGPIVERFGVPVEFDTDVNGAALAEHHWGVARGLSDFVYFTIGTGIGGGAMVAGKILHGLIHTEMGHMRISHDHARDPFPGQCTFHGDCFEGLACGPAMEKRWGAKAQTLPPEHPAWELEAHYIAMAMQSVVCMLSPQRIILGGGVMSQASLFPMIRANTVAALNGYIQAPEILIDIDSYIVPPGMGNNAGVLGAMALAKMGAA